MNNTAFIDFLKKYLSIQPDALAWIAAYAIYCHAIDDAVDNELPKNREEKEFLVDTIGFSLEIYSNVFYVKNIGYLYPIIKMAHNSYRTSVTLEELQKINPTRWKAHVSDCLRQLANEVTLATIELVCGLEVRKKAALELWEMAYKHHHNELGEAI